MKKIFKLKTDNIIVGLLVFVTLVAGGMLASIGVKADSDNTTVVDEITVMIPVACSMSGTVTSQHTDTVTADSYTENIGVTDLKVTCNDFNGFSIYAVGFTDNTEGTTTMRGVSSNLAIPTGVYHEGDTTSSWAMKLTKVTNPGEGDPDITYNPNILSITNGYSDYNVVPSSLTQVVEYKDSGDGSSATDQTLGAHVQTTYAAYVSGSQAADTYTGQVKYVLVHPANFATGTYNIAYNANGGSGSMASETSVHNYEPFTLPASTFTPPNGYVFAGWCTVRDQTQNPQTTCTGDSYTDQGTIPASTVATGNPTPTLNLYAYWKVPPTINDLSYMQDFAMLSGVEKTAVLSSMTTGAQYQLKDSRDQKEYYISKLADGNVWMTQNLDFDIVDGGSELDYTNTDVPEEWEDAGYLNDTYMEDDSTWHGYYDESESYDPGDVCWLGEGEYDYDDTCVDRHYHLGNYYNWTAAVAMSDSSGYVDDGEDVDQSICPAGWTLPKDDGGSNTNSGTYHNLVSQYGWNDSTYTLYGYTMWGGPLYFPLSGYYENGNIEDFGYDGYYWSSVVDDSDYAYSLGFYDHGYVVPDDIDIRYGGNPVRCVARQ